MANAVTSPTVVSVHPSSGGHGQQGGGDASGGSGGGPSPATGQFWNITPLPTDAPFALLPGKQPFSDMSAMYAGKLGLEPPIFLDEKKRFFDHLNQIRRVNIGDDNADSAGYGLYLVRMPVSIQPGEITLKGHGALLTVTARHEFDPNFLKNTFHSLVINDLVDQLAPIVYELIRNGVLEKRDDDSNKLGKLRQEYFDSQMEYARKSDTQKRLREDFRRRVKDFKEKVTELHGTNIQQAQKLRIESLFQELDDSFGREMEQTNASPLSAPPRATYDIITDLQEACSAIPRLGGGDPGPGGPDSIQSDLFSITSEATNLANLANALPGRKAEIGRLKESIDKQIASISQLQSALAIERVASWSFPSTRFGVRTYPVAPSNIDNVFFKEGIFALVRKTWDSLPTATARANDVRNYLRHEIESAYDMLPYYQCDVEEIAEMVGRREFTRLRTRAFPNLVAHLPGDLKGQPDEVLSVLCWSVAVECGLLDRQLKRDIKATAARKGNRALTDPEAADSLLFYEAEPTPEAEETFERYIRARWPIIVFALDPVVDQQNIADASSLRRDLQLALAFSFATGKINFNQLDQFNRKIEMDAETIALNRTVTSFSHGAETFGWRFYPRFQNPPRESSNLQVIGNMLWRGGPGRNYQMNHSKLEAGERELTAVIIMPSFLERVRFDTTGNWFPLHDPDEMEIPTARMIEQGHKVVALRRALESPDICEHYRPDDLDRLSIRVDQIEAMLPMQTHRVPVPYENALGGFQLFTPGSTALVPEVTGFEGVEWVDEGKPTDIMIFGRHFSLHETKVVVGGKVLVPDDAIPPTTKSLGGTQVDIVSREVVHLKLPADVRPTMIRNITDKELARTEPLKPKPYVEVFLATPTGISNRLLIPYKPKDAAPPAGAEPSGAIEAGYVLLDDTLKIQASITPARPAAPRPATAASQPVTVNNAIVLSQTNAAGSTGAEAKPGAANPARPAVLDPAGKDQAKPVTVKALTYPSWEKLRIMPTRPPANDAGAVDVEFHFPVERDVYISVKAPDVAYKDGSYLIPADSLTKLADDFVKKLHAYDKLIGKDGITEVVSRSVLMGPKGSDGPPKVTHNPLKVTILLFTEPAEASPADAKESPATTDGGGASSGGPAGAAKAEDHTSYRPAGRDARPDSALSQTVHEPPVTGPEPSGPPEFGQLPPLPAPPAPARPRVVQSAPSAPTRPGTTRRSGGRGRPSTSRTTSPRSGMSSAPPASNASPATRLPRRSILSRIMGNP